MSHILIKVLVIYLCQKTGNFLYSFRTSISTFNKIKTGTYIKKIETPFPLSKSQEYTNQI